MPEVPEKAVGKVHMQNRKKRKEKVGFHLLLADVDRFQAIK